MDIHIHTHKIVHKPEGFLIESISPHFSLNSLVIINNRAQSSSTINAQLRNLRKDIYVYVGRYVHKQYTHMYTL